MIARVGAPAIVDRLHRTHVDVKRLPAQLYWTPEQIAGAVDAKLTELNGLLPAEAFAAYAEQMRWQSAGGAGLFGPDRDDVERLPGAHCYGFLVCNAAWDAMQEDEAGTNRPDRLSRAHFEALIVRPHRFDTTPS